MVGRLDASLCKYKLNPLCVCTNILLHLFSLQYMALFSTLLYCTVLYIKSRLGIQQILLTTHLLMKVDD